MGEDFRSECRLVVGGGPRSATPATERPDRSGSESRPCMRTEGVRSSSSAGPASSSEGKRSTSVPIAIRASRRASAAPRQWWRRARKRGDRPAPAGCRAASQSGRPSSRARRGRAGMPCSCSSSLRRSPSSRAAINSENRSSPGFCRFSSLPDHRGTCEPVAPVSVESLPVGSAAPASAPDESAPATSAPGESAAPCCGVRHAIYCTSAGGPPRSSQDPRVELPSAVRRGLDREHRPRDQERRAGARCIR